MFGLGLLFTLQKMPANGIAVVFTDHKTKNYDLQRDIISLKNEKDLDVIVVLDPKYRGTVNDSSWQVYNRVSDRVFDMETTTLDQLIAEVYKRADAKCTTTSSNRHRIRFKPEQETYAGIEEGTDHIHAIVDNGLGDFVDRTSFIFREGLCGTPGYISLESTLYPGKFWRHQGLDVKLHDRADDDLFKKDSCFLIVDDKCGAGSVSFYAVNYPDHLITKCGNQLRIEPETGDTCGSSDNFCWVLVNF